MNGQSYGFQVVKKVGNYKIKKTLGEGSEGIVFLVENKNKQYAMKQINSDLKVNLSIYNNIKPNENLVQFIEAFVVNKAQYVIYEYCNGENLTSKMRKQKFSHNSIVLLLRQICNGYKELISNNIIHRDIKPDNIVFHNDQAKIADFGFARFVLDPQEMITLTAKCTPLYGAPQIFSGFCSSKCDIWSLGLILYQLIYGQLPNSQVINFDQLFEFHRFVKENKLDFPKTDKQQLVNLTKLMIKYHEEDRIDWLSLFNHPFVTGEEENRIGLQFGTQELYAQRYFENKVEQFEFFKNLTQHYDDADSQLIVLNLWNQYIRHLTAQINGTVLMESIVQSQIFYTKTPHCQQLKKIIAKYKDIIEKQIKIFDNLKKNKEMEGFLEKIVGKQQLFKDTNSLLQQLHCDQITKDQIQYILFN